jgi:hypothetical protein
MAKRHPMESSVAVIAIALAAMPLTLSDAAEAADALLSGAIASATGEKLGGVTVSAKAAGQTITTTVFTDETGKYYFPPLPNRDVSGVGSDTELRHRKERSRSQREQAPGFHPRPA